MSRPTKLTPAVQAKIIQAITAGNWRYVAAGYANVPSKTLDHWLSRGRKGEGKLYIDFLRAVEKAENEAEIRLTLALVKAGESDWKAAVAYLERKFPERWGRREHRTLDVTARQDGGEGVNLSGYTFSPEWLGNVLAPFPEAKAAVVAAMKALIEERKKKQIEDKG